MKKFLFLILFLGFHLCLQAQAPDTIQVNIVANDTIGACLENQFVASFNADSLHRISIEPLLDFDGDSVNSCLDSINHPQVFLVLDSSSLPVSFQVLDTSTGKWTATITGTGLCTLYYHIYIDCSVILTTNTLTLSQVWTDSLSYVYLVDGNIDTSASIVVEKPHLLDIGPSSFSAIFLDTLSLTFMYKNTNLGTANILARFFPDSSNYCSSLPPLLPPLGFFYRIGKNGTPNSYVPGTEIPITLYTSDTLIFEELVIDSLCVYCDTVCTNGTCQREANFEWKCNVPPAINNVFCNDCQNVYTRSYNVINAELHQVKVELAPASLPNIDNDKSCLNDTTFLQWDYIITNPGVSAIDSLKLNLEYFNDDQFTHLTLIPTSTFSVVSNCSSCILSTNSTLRDSALCTNLVPDPLRRAWSSIKHFHPGDTVWVSFSTFRCGVENDTALLNLPKSFNQWRLYVNGITVCGDQASIIHSTPIGSSTTNGKYNLDLKLQFIPSITDLSVPAGATFGDSARFEIESKSIVTSVEDFQLFGAAKSSKTSGWMRATIHCERGLVVQNRESEVYFQYFDVDSNKNIIVEPKFYHASIPLNFCDTGNYFFYFDLGDTLMLKAINGGEFIFNLQACCNINSNPPATDFEVKFHLFPNPDSCFNLTYNDTAHILPPNCTGISCDAWIPLSSSASRIFTHCPGCLAPGIIVQDYKMKRISFGLQDSNNDGLADNSLTQIMNPSPWFTSHENDLIQHFSSYGDQLEDKMTAYFQDGDSSSGGYNYIQLRNIGLTLPFLQLSRIIPAGLDTMKAFPLEFTFYIDSIMSPSNCIDCDGFSLDTSITRTLYKLNVSGANLNQYLDVVQNENRLLFTFDGSIDSLNQLIGNLGSNSPYLDSTYSFNGFYEGQRYRLKVRYANCGNFIGENIDNTTLASVMIKSEITNKMWLSGSKQDHSKPQMYNTVDELRDSLNMTVYPIDTLYQLMDTSYTNNYLFFCETFGGVHYFFTQEARNYSVLDTAVGCDKNLTVVAHTETAGYPYIINIYPFEYRPPMLWPKSYEINVPSGYYISQSLMSHGFRFINDPFLKYTNWVAFDLIDSVGNFTIYDSTLSPPICISDTLYPIALSDTNMYVKSALTLRFLQFTLSPLGCDSNSNYLISNDSMAIIKFGNQNISCVDSNSCSITEITRRSNLEDDLFTLLPNLVVQASPPTINVTGNQVCITLNLSNILKEISDGVNSTTASNVFLALPDTVSVLFLHNWVYYSPDTIYPSGQIIQIDTLFDVNLIDTGILCASFRNCGNTLSDTSYFTFYTGWNCGGFPSSPFDADSVCGATPQTITLIKSSASLSNSGKSPVPNTVYSLCDTIIAEADFVSTGGGYLYPTFVNLDSIPRGMGVQAVYLISIVESVKDSVLLTYNNTTQNYPIDTAQMSSLNFPGHAYYSGQSIKVKALLIPTCEYTSDSLPQIEFYALDYCDSVHESPATFQGSIDIVGSNCYDCFTLEKTILEDTIHVGDTVHFVITLTANNGFQQAVYLTDIIPLGFDTIGTYDSLWITPLVGSISDTIVGIFTMTGDCPDMTNTARMFYQSYDSLNVPNYLGVMYADTCVEVISACISDTTIIFADSGIASLGYDPSYVNQNIYLEGTFFVDMNMSFENCIIKAKAGSSIVLLGSNTLNFYNTTISACDTMWQGIIVDYIGTVILENLNSIQDANEGINLGTKGSLLMVNSEIINSVTGVIIPPLYPNVFGGTLDIRESTFGMYSTILLPAYVGQPSHDTILPYAGMNLNDATLEIGSDDYSTNIFHNMNIGIRGYRSALDIYNCTFDNIRVVPFYNIKGNASAVVSIGDTALGIASAVRVNPLPTSGGNMDSCNNGVYTFYSELRIYGCTLDHMKDGIQVNHCKDGLLTAINGNTINARSCGINLYDNYGGAGQNIDGNYITIDGDKTGVGITAKELTTGSTFRYNITSNRVDLVNGKSGIEINGLDRSMVSYNFVQLSDGISTSSTTSGVIINGGQNNTVSCNQVYGFGDDDTLRNGYKVSLSPYNSILCNHSDSIGYAFLFEGATCTNTKFKGNYLGVSYSGLYLNSAAIIGLQPTGQTPPYHGNVWIDTLRYSSGFGAVNINTTQNNVLFSIFTTNQSVAGHNPKIPLSTGSIPFLVDDNGWFFKFPTGSHFDCAHTGTCATASEGGGDEEFRMMVIEDSSITSEFIEESKIMAQQEVYNELLHDSVLRNSNELYSDFVTDKFTSSIGELHQVESKIKESILIDSALQASIIEVRGELQFKIDSLFNIIQLMISDTSSYLVFLKENLLEEVENDKIAISDLVQQLKTQSDAVVTSVSSLNSSISTLGIPDANEKLINEIYLRYRKEGIDVITQEYENILQVAIQCPSSGGSSVHRARIFIAQVNDSMEYNDGDVCATMGIFRMIDPNGKNILEPKLICFPNPASSSLQLLFNGLSGAEFNLEIHDSSGRLISSKKFTSVSGAYYLNTSSLSNGLFHLLVRDNTGKNVSSKFIVSR